MTHRSFARPAIAFLATATFVACSKSTPTTTASPAPTSSPAASSAAARPSNALPAGVTLAMVTQGDSIYHARSCARCHGADAKGATNGPDLTTATHTHVNGSYDDFVRIITDGVPKDSLKVATHPFPMPARGGPRPAPLTDPEIRSVAAYVYSLSHK
jgi:mono/diheme cytochrome c family protein